MLDQLAGNIEQYMSLLGARQKLVAANIANADTPGYKTKDVDFHSELEKAMGKTAPRVVEASGLKSKSDGNNVSLDREARLLAENALRFNFAAQLVKAQIRMVRSALEDIK